MPDPVIIVGGGISGLSAAYYLSKAGIPSIIIERRPRLGGVIQTEYIQGCALEAGPDSYLSMKPAATELIREVGLGADLIGSNDHQRITFIWKGGRLVPLPDGLMMMVPTKITPMITSPLLGWGTKIRMGLEYFRRPNGSKADRSVADFITDHYGRESFDYLAEPLLSGVYGGDPRLLSASSVLTRFVDLESKYGSLTKGVLASRRAQPPSKGGALFQTLKNGLATLVGEVEKRIAPSSKVIHGGAVLVQQGRVKVDDDWVEGSHVILACPAYEAGRLLGGQLGDLLNQVDYSSSLTLSFGYDKKSLGGDVKGFGLLVPSKERNRLVACTWVQNKFSHRVPEGKAVLRCFFGGAGDEKILSEPDDRLLEIARDEVRRILGITAEPLFHTIARWPRSMAQYTVGHAARMKQVDGLLAERPRIYLAGNAYTGIGLPDCIRSGREAAEKIAAAG